MKRFFCSNTTFIALGRHLMKQLEKKEMKQQSDEGKEVRTFL